MPTSARKRRNFDMGRLREAIRGPGADTRVWLATARVDDDPDAVVWDAELGWLVDVTFYGGPLDQEGPVPCRLGTIFAQAGATKADPPGANCEVLVAITDGDANSNPTIVARIHNAGGCQAPEEVNGDEITEEKASSTHITVTPHGADEQYGGARRISAPTQELQADTRFGIRGAAVELGGAEDAPPTEAAVLGNLLDTALGTLVDALNVYATALGTGTLPTDPVTVGVAAAAAQGLQAALEGFSAAVAAALSAKVKLE
jgi:hypothetical protein